MMKNIKLSTWVLTCFIILGTGCSDFLDENPESALAGSSFFQSENDGISAVTGIYSRLTQRRGAFNRGLYTRDFPVVLQNLGDQSRGRGGTRANYNNFVVDASDVVSTNFWGASILTISYIATTIDGIQGIPDVSEERKNKLIGEAKFIRALLYFNMVQAFGPNPLIVDPPKAGDDFNVPRRPESVIYNQIIEDLMDARATLPSKADQEIGRATSEAATALLGKIYLILKRYDDAEAALKEVIDSGQYVLLDFYGDLWRASNDNNDEYIFSVQHTTDINPSFLNSFFGVQGLNRQPFGGFGAIQLNIEYAESFESGDIRRQWTVIEEDIDGNPIALDRLGGRKFVELEDDRFMLVNNSSKDFVVLRYADVLLMYAEVLNELGRTGEAFSFINAVRTRARNGDPLANPQDYAPGSLSQDEFRDAVLQERHWELGTEGHVFVDLKRTDRLVSAMAALGVTVPSNDYIVPLPQAHIDSNPNLVNIEE